jgi:hypothetical protein
MAVSEIKKVKDNYDKMDTYIELNETCTKAIEEGNYFTVIILSYAMIEDRLLSLLHHLYLVDRNLTKPRPDTNVKDLVMEIMEINRAGKLNEYDFFKLSSKINLISKVIKNRNYNNLSKDVYDLLDKEIGIQEINEFLEKLRKWSKCRNEIVHGAFNKSKQDLLKEIKVQAKIGYDLSKQISKFVGKVKVKKKSIRLHYELKEPQYV